MAVKLSNIYSTSTKRENLTNFQPVGISDRFEWREIVRCSICMKDWRIAEYAYFKEIQHGYRKRMEFCM